MRIAMLLHKSLEFDTRVQREASALAAAGHRVWVLELAPVPAGHAESSGYSRYSVQSSRRRPPGRRGQALAALWFVRAIVRLRPQVVHAHDAAMLVPGLVGARLVGARLVYDSHELAVSVTYRERTWAWFVRTIERLVVPRCDAVITVSEGIAARLEQAYRLTSPPVVVRNVSALTRRGSGGLRRALGVDADAAVVLHQGAPAPDRGCEVLIEAAASLDDARLVFLGDPEPGYGERVRALIAARALPGRISLLPSVPPAELLAWTAEADVGVTLLQDTCENHRLALPNKLFEYIAAAVPVVASALPEIERLVETYGVGWCVAPGDPSEVARALRHALATRTDAGLRARLTRAAAELTWDNERARLVGLYAKLDG